MFSMLCQQLVWKLVYIKINGQYYLKVNDNLYAGQYVKVNIYEFIILWLVWRSVFANVYDNTFKGQYPMLQQSVMVCMEQLRLPMCVTVNYI